jgi:phosphoglycerate kinase
MSHLGRPKDGPVEKYSLKHLVTPLSLVFGVKVKFASDCISDEAVELANGLQAGEILLIENLRFYKEEEKGDVDFAKKLARLGNVWVNDAFGTAHRPHSSIVGINLSIRASGLLMNKEISYFSKALETPQKPFLVIMGGAKVKDKIKLILNMLENVNDMIIAGGLSFTFLRHLKGMKTGNSIYDKEGEKLIDEIMKKVNYY